MHGVLGADCAGAPWSSSQVMSVIDIQASINMTRLPVSGMYAKKVFVSKCRLFLLLSLQPQIIPYAVNSLLIPYRMLC